MNGIRFLANPQALPCPPFVQEKWARRSVRPEKKMIVSRRGVYGVVFTWVFYNFWSAVGVSRLRRVMGWLLQPNSTELASKVGFLSVEGTAATEKPLFLGIGIPKGRCNVFNAARP